MVYSSLLNNENVACVEQMGGIQVLQYVKDMSVIPITSKQEYFCAKMNVNKRQVLLNLNGNGYTVQSGAMQWMSGNVRSNSGVTGVGNFLGKMVSGAVTGESAVKPVYEGEGQVMLEPTYKHILITDLAEWGGSVVMDDGLFLACENTVQNKVTARSNLSSAVLGGEGLFNTMLTGYGLAVFESKVPRNELIEINLQNDVMKIDGNMAVAWSGSLEFTVEKSGKSLVGSAASGEGLVNVYRGTGKIWMAPVTGDWIAPLQAEAAVTSSTTGQTGSSNTSTSAGNSTPSITDVADAASKIMNLFN